MFGNETLWPLFMTVSKTTIRKIYASGKTTSRSRQFHSPAEIRGLARHKNGTPSVIRRTDLCFEADYAARKKTVSAGIFASQDTT
jgi:hypothetical protein